MNATDRLRILNNIVAKVGIEGDIIGELAKVESMINAMDQGKMIPPPLPPELNEQVSQDVIPPEETTPMEGKYDNI